ncbi:Lipoprotein signal peptidase [Bathymodiolus heckerae thiotrophic gill symbiont]|uniref:signal peptidase II n=1 Tax=Bathymodiolus heckerae thiotrophic gill symbiont TaxID=1052212 RepID=UPI0010B2C78B|nr:signal peptidase II [Bathymodiolus heckerae thiotrophic gill symbiont]SMN13130.1 Lipoprotein signal peptidase [Bathymodiolus heckerae thiotrophic gill symbiont]SMN14301.1 Lipoprotein signal peptidase [uncultured Candidatus Thioglobus sp.]
MSIRRYYSWALALVLLDQISKLSAYEYLGGIGNSVDINEYFRLTFVHNYGAAFSFLADQGGWQRYFLSGVSATAGIVITVWMFKTPLKYKFKLISLTLILSGAVGNMIDRIVNGFVIDFIELHYQTFYWPIFNFADIFISLGVLLLIIVDWKK